MDLSARLSRNLLERLCVCHSALFTGPVCKAVSCCRDCVVYSSHCHKLAGRKVAVKVYEKSSLSPSKLRAVKREAAMMIYMTRKRCDKLRHHSEAPSWECTVRGLPIICRLMPSQQDSRQQDRQIVRETELQARINCAGYHSSHNSMGRSKMRTRSF